jgi:hypothetical protein
VALGDQSSTPEAVLDATHLVSPEAKLGSRRLRHPLQPPRLKAGAWMVLGSKRVQQFRELVGRCAKDVGWQAPTD